MIGRRHGNAAFAQRWEAAVAAAHARFHLAGGTRAPDADRVRGGREGERAPLDFARGERKAGAREAGRGGGSERKRDPGLRRDDGRGLRTKGGEAVVVRTKGGRLQLRSAHAGKLTKAAEQAFLTALSATANIRLSAAAAGASPAAFYRRAQRNPAFAREMRLALQMGYERLELAALRSALPESFEDDGWRHNSPPPIPPMTADQALQLLFLHEKSVHQSWEKPHRRRRRGESDETHCERLRAMWTAEKRQEAEDEAVRRAARYEESGDWRFEEEAPPPELPPLHLVTGWSRADPAKTPHDPRRTLFGGWRLEHMRGKLGRK